MLRAPAFAMLLLPSAGCGLVGPMCVSQQERGSVTTVSGSIAAGEIVTHRLNYDTRGSQNDARIDWPGQRDADAPQLQVYATRASCEAFTLPTDANTGACAILARGGWAAPGVVSGLIITHGRGNPERLGTPPEYKLWITSDLPTSYRLTITYFYGPDC